MAQPKPGKGLITLVGRLYDSRFGWRPSRGKLKPVHVAHNVASALAPDLKYDTSALFQFVSVSKANSGIITDHSFDVLSRRYGDALGTLAGDRVQFSNVRNALKLLVDADGAAFAEKSNFAPTLTSHRMTDGAGSYGGFEAFLLSFMGDGTPLRELAQDALLDETGPIDPVTALATPLLAQQPKAQQRSVEGRSDRVAAMARYPEFLRVATLAGDCLARNESSNGYRLSRLQRIVRFSCLMIYRHIQEAAASAQGGRRPPMLIDYSYWRRNNIAAASMSSFRRLTQGFSDWIEAQMRQEIETRGGLPGMSVMARWDRLDRSDVARAVDDLVRFEGGAAEVLTGVRSARSEERIELIEGVAMALPEANSSEILAKAMTQLYLEESDYSPNQALRFLGEHLGLLYPTSGQQKRFRPAPALLDVMVRGCVEPGEYLAYRDFLRRVWDRFGFVVGPDQMSTLRNVEIDVSAQALGENQNMLLDALVETGLAKRLADHEAIVGIDND